MTTLVLGASGATGRLVVQQLLAQGKPVKAMVRSTATLPDALQPHENLTIVEASAADLSVAQWQQHLASVESVVSCLGHRVSFRGIYGHPRRLVTDVLKRIYNALEQARPEQPIRYVLMNSTGVRNTELNEKHSCGEKIVIGLLRHLLPPHADNEDAARFLREQVGRDNLLMHWVIVRPDGLIDATEVTDYVEKPLPLLSPIFDNGKVSRINVGHFMMKLVTDDDTWQRWVWQSPVLYNREAVQ